MKHEHQINLRYVIFAFFGVMSYRELLYLTLPCPDDPYSEFQRSLNDGKLPAASGPAGDCEMTQWFEAWMPKGDVDETQEHDAPTDVRHQMRRAASPSIAQGLLPRQVADMTSDIRLSPKAQKRLQITFFFCAGCTPWNQMRGKV